MGSDPGVRPHLESSRISKETELYSIVRPVEKQSNIVKTWLEKKPIVARTAILARVSKSVVSDSAIPIERVIEHIAAGLLAICATEMGLTPVELTSLLRSPKKDALSSLVTMIHNARNP